MCAGTSGIAGHASVSCMMQVALPDGVGHPGWQVSLPTSPPHEDVWHPMFCHNCRCVMEGLLFRWELASAAEIVAKALLQPASQLRGDDGPGTFRVLSHRADECSEVCCPPGEE